MDSQEKRRDTKKLQNKKRRQKWHFLRDCCVAFVGRKMKCEGQGELEGGGGHVENGMSKSKKQKRSVWEVRLIYEKWGRSQRGWLLSDGLGGGGDVRGWDEVFAVWWTEKNLWYGSFEQAFQKKMELYRKKGDENKTKKIITSLWRRISLSGRLSRERQRRESNWVGNKDGEAQGSEQKRKKCVKWQRQESERKMMEIKWDKRQLPLMQVLFNCLERGVCTGCLCEWMCMCVQAEHIQVPAIIKFT